MVGSMEASDDRVGTLEVISFGESVCTEQNRVNYSAEKKTVMATPVLVERTERIAIIPREFSALVLGVLYLPISNFSGLSKLYEASNSWHSKWWTSKFFILIILMAIPFFIPVDFIRVYGMLEQFTLGHQLLIGHYVNLQKAFPPPVKEELTGTEMENVQLC
ncbi:hypothetical protein ACLOJK_007519 [Asimina triloba]